MAETHTICYIFINTITTARQILACTIGETKGRYSKITFWVMTYHIIERERRNMNREAQVYALGGGNKLV